MTHLLQSIAEDIGFAFRMMKRSLGLTAMAVLSLALGIGATIAIFSVIYALALKPLPVQQPDQLVEVVRADGIDLHSYEEWKLFRDEQDIFSDVLAYNVFDTVFRIGPANQQSEVSGLYVSGDYFRALGVQGAFGRVLQPSDDQPGATPVCVIGYGLWRRLFGQSRNILGQKILVNRNEFQIVGVAPQSFFGVEIGNVPEVFMPLEAERTYTDYQLLYGHQHPSLDDPNGTIVTLVARLESRVSVSQANAGLQVLVPEMYKALPPRHRQSDGSVVSRSLAARPLASGAWEQNMDMMLLLMIMAAVALIIACANLGNLLLARAAIVDGECGLVCDRCRAWSPGRTLGNASAGMDTFLAARQYDFSRFVLGHEACRFCRGHHFIQRASVWVDSCHRRNPDFSEFGYE